MRCLNWKVIAAVVAIGIGVYALAPGVAGGAVPLLVLAVCPLSMLLMMRAMGSMGSRTSELESGDRDEMTRLRAEVDALRAEREGK